MRGLLLLVGLLVPVSGCFTCAPQLDIRHCPQPTGTCDPSGQEIAWNPDLQDLFPDLHCFVMSLADGDHGHAQWTTAQAEAFWRFYHVDTEAPNKQVFLQAEGELFRVRVLAC